MEDEGGVYLAVEEWVELGGEVDFLRAVFLVAWSLGAGGECEK